MTIQHNKLDIQKKNVSRLYQTQFLKAGWWTFCLQFLRPVWIFAVGFDAMGLTDNENPIGLMPFLNPGFGIIGKRKKRNAGKTSDPEIQPHKIAGGER